MLQFLLLASDVNAFWPIDNIVEWFNGDGEETPERRVAVDDWIEARPDFWPEERAADAVYRTSATVPDDFHDWAPEEPAPRSAEAQLEDLLDGATDVELEEILAQLETMLPKKKSRSNAIDESFTPEQWEAAQWDAEPKQSEPEPSPRSMTESELDEIERELDEIEAQVLGRPEARGMDDMTDAELDNILRELESMLPAEERAVEEEPMWEPEPEPRAVETEDDVLDEIEELINSGDLTPEERSTIQQFLEEELAAEEALEEPAPRAVETEDDVLDEIEELINSGDLTPEQRSMIQQALEEELAAEMEEEMPFEEPAPRAAETEEMDELDELEQLIMSGDLSREQRSMIKQVLEEELAAEEQPVIEDFEEPEPRSALDEMDNELDELEQLIESGDLTPQERAMIQDALAEELKDLETMQREERAVEFNAVDDDFWPEEPAAAAWEPEPVQNKPVMPRGIEDMDVEELDSLLDELEQLVEEKRARELPKRAQRAPQCKHCKLPKRAQRAPQYGW